MAAILKKSWVAYKYVFEELPDPRTKDWFLVAKPYQGIFLLGLYLMFVFKWGPKWMIKRPPFDLERLLIGYNVLQVVACLYLFVNSVWYAWGWDYKWICEPVDYTVNERSMKIAGLVYFYYILKVLDLLDTVFFVLRKKFTQMSFLHIYHHTGMVLLVWGAVTYLPGGHGTLIGVINSLVHVVMYSYYLLTVAKPSVKGSVWWKKHITQLQIVQFFWCIIHMLFVVFKTDCEYPRWTAAIFLPQDLFMLVLFIDFYVKAYIKRPKITENGTHQNNAALNEHTLNGTQNGNIKNGLLKKKV